MRKPVSCALVGLMLLSLFGFFGGVVEEAEGTANYDSGSNTIFVSGLSNDLFTIWSEISDPNTFDLIAANTYITYANIHVLEGAILTVDQGNTLRFNTSLYMAISGILNVNGIQGNPVVFTSNSTTPSQGDWQGLIFNTTEASNSVLNYVNISYATEGIFCDGSSPEIADSIITQNSDYGLFCDGASPHILDTEISGNGNGGGLDAGIYLLTSSPLIENTSFINNPDRDLLIQSDSHPISLNSSFSLVIFLDVNSNLTVKWYLEIYLEDDNSGFPIDGASVIVKDIFGNTVSGSPFTTNFQGVRSWIVVTEFVSSTSLPVYHTPHNITATHPEFYQGYADPEPYLGSSKQVQVNLTMIRRDLTTNEDNITFTPSGVPVANEDLQVQARIHNIETDKADDVRVTIEDDAPEGITEIYNVTFSSILGYNFEDAIKIWQPSPGQHTITVYIDPFNEISEINSNIFIDAEANNEVSVTIDVNERPLINITAPQENEEVNGIYDIKGHAYDNPNDAPTPNEISRIDIRLIGYDWVNLFFPINIKWNFTSNDWDWDYNWNTEQWNGTPIIDGNYTLQARAWDGYHYSFIYETNIFVNNTGGNRAPVVIINEPINNTAHSVNETITFNGTLSFDPDGDLLTFIWDFDDGDFGSGNLTTHSFAQKGWYNVSLTVNDTQTSNTTYVTVIIDNTPPYAELTASTDTAFVNETITFYGYNSTDEETPTLLEYFWDFDDTTDTDGDGNFTNDIDFFSVYPVENTTYIYTESGTYTVTLRVWDGRINSTDTVTVQILDNAAPTAVINEPLTGQFSVNETIFFNASASSDPNDSDLDYFWDFGDGTNSSWLDESTTTHFYLDYGPNILPVFRSYTVTLQVRDAGGLSDSTFIYVVVNNYPPVANATSNVTTSSTYMEITFDGSNSDDQESPGTITFLWNFDDGNTSSDEITSHQFANNGDYNVTLLVTDSAGANDTDWIIITITNRDPVIDNVTIYPSQPIMSEEITFTVNATDDDGIIVEYEWNFGDTGIYSETAANAPDGAFDGKTTHSYPSKTSYSVTVIVKDDDGAYNSTQFWVDIANTPPDTEITFPNENDQVSGTITIEGTSDDLDGSVSEVEVKIDNGEWKSASGTDPWTFTWDTSDHYNGKHTIYARAYDSQNYTNPPANKTVDVSNSKSSITLTVNLDPTTVETGGAVIVYGDAIYNTGEPVATADVNISIVNEGVNWATKTDANGFYSQNITAPSDAGSYWIKASITRSGLSESEQERLTVEVPPSQPDLEITSSDISFNINTPYSGEVVQIQVSVENIGTEEAQGVVVNAYYGDPASGGRPTSPDSTKTISQIPGGETGFTTFNWDTSDITGSQDIYIVVDPGNSISESNEDNNKDYKSITIEGRADFEIDSDDITFSNDNPTVDDTISIFIDIRNIGTERKGVKYKVYDGDPDDTGILIDSGDETINGDDEANLIITWTPDEAGTHLVYVVLEPKTGVEESDDSNNEASASITVEEKPGDDEPSSNLLPMIIVLVVIVLLIIIILYRRGQGEKPQQQNIPSASVIQKTSVAKVVEPKKEKEEEPMMDGQGGMRI